MANTNLARRFVLCKPDKRPLHFKWQRRDHSVEEVREWLAKDPRNLVGVVPGTFGLAVVDGDEGFEPKVADMADELASHLAGGVPEINMSGSGKGAHLWYRRPKGGCGNLKWRTTLNDGRQMAGDIRCDNGYLIVWDKPVFAKALKRLEEKTLPDLPLDKVTEEMPRKADGTAARSTADQLGISDSRSLDELIGKIEKAEHPNRHDTCHLAVKKAALLGYTPAVQGKLRKAISDLFSDDPARAKAELGRVSEWFSEGRLWREQHGPVVLPVIPRHLRHEDFIKHLPKIGLEPSYNSRTEEFAIYVRDAGVGEDGKKRTSRLSLTSVEGRTASLVYFKERTREPKLDDKTGRPIVDEHGLMHTKPCTMGGGLWTQLLARDFVGRAQDPLLEWIFDNAPDGWDGTDRLTDWVVKCSGAVPDAMGAEQRGAWNWYGRLVTVGMLRQTLSPGGVHVIPIIRGRDQGTGKTSLTQFPLPPAMRPADPQEHSDETSRPEVQLWKVIDMSILADAKRLIEEGRGLSVLEIGHMAQGRKAEIAAVKQLAMVGTLRARTAYATKAETVPRTYIVVGTSNEKDPVPDDPTGVRRFCLLDLPPGFCPKTAWLWWHENRAQVLAQALHEAKLDGNALSFPTDLAEWREKTTAAGRSTDPDVEGWYQEYMADRDDPIDPIEIVNAMRGEGWAVVEVDTGRIDDRGLPVMQERKGDNLSAKSRMIYDRIGRNWEKRRLASNGKRRYFWVRVEKEPENDRTKGGVPPTSGGASRTSSTSPEEQENSAGGKPPLYRASPQTWGGRVDAGPAAMDSILDDIERELEGK